MPGLTRSFVTAMESKNSSSNETSPAVSPRKAELNLSERKRRSVSKPDYYGSSPILSSSSPGTPKRKPKRSIVPSNSSGNESDSSTGADFDEEEVPFRKPQSIKRPIGSKAKTTPKRGDRKSATKRISSGNGKESLFDIVKGGKSALQAVLNDWIDCYAENRISAVVDLIQYFIQCCGCKGEVTQDMIESDDTVAAIRQLTEKFDEDSHEYPMIMAGPASKKFKSNFCHFIELLMEGCQNTILFDDFFMDTLISWLIGLSDSQVRAFRHTSTIAALKLVTALTGIVVTVGVERDHAKKQMETESKKPASKRSRERIEILTGKHDELEQKMSDLQETMDCVFSGIFVHRYRDVRPEIRSACIAELGTWMQSYSSYFLNQDYLKYTGWTLHDKIGDVRLKALQSLECLYGEEDFVTQLDLFTKRFKDRMVGMTMDKDADVAVHAIKLAALLLQHDDILNEEDCVAVEKLVFSKVSSVAREAGKFFVIRLSSRSERLSPTKRRKGAREMLKKCSFIKLMIEFFLKSEVHQQTAYLVDSLHDHCQLIKDWKLLTDMLLDAHPVVDLSDEEEGVLIDLLAASCSQSATGNPPVGRIAKRTVKDKRLILEDKHTLSTHFVALMPDLMRKFGADVNKLSAIISISHHFDLDVYSEKALKNKLQELLDLINDMFLRHSDKGLLEICAQSLRSLDDSDFAFKQMVEVSKSRLIDEVVEKFTKALSNGIPTEADKNDQYYFDLGVNLKRITALARCHDLEEWGIFKYLNEIIQRGTSGSVEDELLVNALTCTHLVLLWGLTSLSSTQPNKTKLKALRKRVATFVGQLDELIQFSNASVQEQAYLMLADVLVFFARQLKNSSPLLAPLVYEADRTVQVRARDYVMSFVFATDDIDDEEDEGSDERSADIDRKRVVLSAFCKLISFNIFDVRLAAPIFGQLVKAYSSYADIIKFTMGKAREINAVAFTKTLMLSLQQSYESLIADSIDGCVVWSSTDLIPIKDLCRKFALIFGVDTKREISRQCVITFHREGILYALRPVDSEDAPSSAVPPNLSFLEVVNEFTYRLIPQDRLGKNGILEFLEEKSKAFNNKKGSDWTPFLTYRSSIAGDSRSRDDQDATPLQARQKTQAKKAGRGRKRQKLATELVAKNQAAAASDSDASEEAADVPMSPLGTSRLDQDSSDLDTANEFQGKPTANAKRQRKTTADSQAESDSDPMDNVPLSSQRSWLSSQKALHAKPRVSYGSNKRPRKKRPRADEGDMSPVEGDAAMTTSPKDNQRRSQSKRTKRAASVSENENDINSSPF